MSRSSRFVLLMVVLCGTACQAPARAQHSVVVWWDANSESDLAEYRVYRGNAPGDYPVFESTSDTSWTKGLASGTWYFAVTAVDFSGNESEFSDEVSITLGVEVPETGYQQRRSLWLSGPGPDGFDPRSVSALEQLSQWIVNGHSHPNVDEAIAWLLDTSPYPGGYWNRGQRTQNALVPIWLILHGDELSSTSRSAMHSRMREFIVTGEMFKDANPNKHLWAAVGTYLYCLAFDSDLQIPTYGCHGSCNNFAETDKEWPNFNENGNQYVFGKGPYSAKQFSRDYVSQVIKSWIAGVAGDMLPGGIREWHSMVYSRAYFNSLVLLRTGLRKMNADSELQSMARVASELYWLDQMAGYQGRTLWGTQGRSDFGDADKRFEFPAWAYTGIGERVVRFGVEDVFLANEDLDPIYSDMVDLSDEPNGYWMLYKSRVDDDLINDLGVGNWCYVTKHYAMGGGTTWQGTIPESSNKVGYVRFWINGLEPGTIDDKKETRWLGSGLNQFRGSAFVDVGSRPYYHEASRNFSWDESASNGGWEFRREGKAFLAYALGNRSAAVELGIEGIDYATFSQFQNNVIVNGVLDDGFFRDSRGVEISAGDNYKGEDVPFDRLSIRDSRGQVADWRNNVLTLTRGGRTRILDFSDWIINDDADADPPSAPSGLRAREN